MKFKFRNTGGVLFGLALLTINAGLGLASAATLTMSGITGNSCSSYESFNSDSSGNLTINGCIVSGGGGGTSSCSLTLAPTNSTITLGATPTLTAACTPVNAATFTWAVSTAAVPTFTAITFTNGSTINPTVNTTYKVTGLDTNNVSLGSATKAVVVSESNGGGDPGWVVPTNCTIIPVTWKFNGLDVTTAPKQTMGANKMHAYKLVVPAGMSLTAAATAYAGVNKLMTVSENACDFISPEFATNKCKSVTGKSKNATVDLAPAGSTLADYCKLPEAGREVFINIKNATSTSTTETCVSGSICTYYVNW